MKALNIDQMLQKRREEVGSKDRFPVIVNATTFWLKDPTIANREWNDHLADAQRNFKDGVYDETQLREIMVDLYLAEDKQQEFVDACDTIEIDPFLAIQMGLQNQADESGKKSYRKYSRIIPTP